MVTINRDSLTSHLSIKCFAILDYFLQAHEDKGIQARVPGKRKREVDLAVPGQYKSHPKNRVIATVLSEQLKSRNKLLTHFELTTMCHLLISPQLYNFHKSNDKKTCFLFWHRFPNFQFYCL